MPLITSNDVVNGTILQRITRGIQDKIDMGKSLNQKGLNWYNNQSKLKRSLVIALIAILSVLTVLMIIFHSYFVNKLIDLSDDWKEFTYGKLILFTLVFFVGFPPLIGYTSLSLLTGMVYGFPQGWPLLAAATVTGSFASFLVFRHFFQNKAKQLTNSNEKFRAFSEILNEKNSLFLLILIRLCPLPYSLSNGALAAIPTLSPQTYLLASTITSPKVLIHLFVGYKLKELGDETKKSNKLIDILSILITILATSITTYVIYNKMNQKLAAYHSNQSNSNENFDLLIYGNFDDDESGNIELNSQEFDADNFIIDDEYAKNRNDYENTDDYPKKKDFDDFEITSDDDTTLPSSSRNY